MKKVRYNRISTANQNLERQLAKNHPDEEIYNDVISGSIPFGERPQGSILVSLIQSYKICQVTVSSIDRLGRNLADIINTLDLMHSHNVTVLIENLGIHSILPDGKKNPTFDLIVSVLANVAAMERETLLERQREGIAIAKAKGIYKGRVRGSKETDEDFLAKNKKVIKLLKEKISVRKTAKLADCSIGNVQKVKKVMQRQMT